MQHEMKLRSIYFDKIKSGKKIYEIRLNDEKRRLINIGDTIIFKKEPDLTESLVAKVTDLTFFSTFVRMLNVIPASEIGFANTPTAEIESEYHKFYTPAEEQFYGVLAIKLSVIN